VNVFENEYLTVSLVEKFEVLRKLELIIDLKNALVSTLSMLMKKKLDTFLFIELQGMT
jgi:hypothetical protein